MGFCRLKPYLRCEPLIQLADLFAGIARFTGEEGIRCVQWLASHGNRRQLKMSHLHIDNIKDRSARRKECRFQLVGELNQICKNCRIGVEMEQQQKK